MRLKKKLSSKGDLTSKVVNTCRGGGGVGQYREGTILLRKEKEGVVEFLKCVEQHVHNRVIQSRGQPVGISGSLNTFSPIAETRNLAISERESWA